MAHFAELDQSNIVLRVVVVSNDDIKDANGVESELLGRQFCTNLFGGNWIQTSYNNNFRKNYASIGYQYDFSRDAFIEPKPFNSWLLDEATCKWNSPVEKPNSTACWWDENTTSWIIIPQYPNDGKNYFYDKNTNSWVEQQ